MSLSSSDVSSGIPMGSSPSSEELSGSAMGSSSSSDELSGSGKGAPSSSSDDSSGRTGERALCPLKAACNLVAAASRSACSSTSSSSELLSGKIGVCITASPSFTSDLGRADCESVGAWQKASNIGRAVV